MRAAIRFLVTLGLVSAAAALAPLAAADPAAGDSARPAATASGPAGDPRSPTPDTSTPSPSSPQSSPASPGPTAPSPSPSRSEPSRSEPSGSEPGVSEPSVSEPSASESPSAATSSTAPETAGTPGERASRQLAVAAPTVTFTHRPGNLGLTKVASFSYRASVPNARFDCRLVSGRQPKAWGRCPADPGGQTGTRTYRHLQGNRAIYHFQVRAREAGRAGPAISDPFRIWTVWSPGRFVPRTGASFNRVLGSPAHQRTNLSRIIKSINGMPGYPQATPATCPRGRWNPGTIRISLYSLTDQSVAKALTAANRRCVSVQVLMNDHLNSANDPAWRRLAGALGTSVYRNGRARHSFAHRCHHACRGGGVLHLKMYLFNSTVPAPRTSSNRIVNTVITGSSNMTSNAAKVQWNDLYAVARNRELFAQFSHQFLLMRRDNGYHRNPARYVASGGRYVTSFAPGPRGYDPWMSALRSVRCSGATGGSGINGHTVLYINMHAWFGARGNALASQVRQLYNRGCYVRVLYSFMGFKKVYRKLIAGASSRMAVRRTLFSRNGRTASYYSHFKSLAISGHVGGNHAARFAYTGSNNWTDEGINFDEVVLRIGSIRAYRSYRNWWTYISRHHSSRVYANYSEPSGGGRAP